MELGEIAGTVLQSPGGILGVIAASLLSGGAVMRKYWMTDKVNSATTGAQVDMIVKLQELLDKAYQRADLADARTDKANAERNEMFTKLGGMTEQIDRLTRDLQEVPKLREQIRLLTEELSTLRKHVNVPQNENPTAT